MVNIKTIYEIEFEESQSEIHDSSFLSGSMDPFNLLFLQSEANSYWSGHTKKNGDSRKELLIKLPVKIIGKVN